MPDWTYHPLFKHVFFQLPGEEARRLTIGLVAMQAMTAPGRALFRALSHGAPRAGRRVRAFGINFPSPVGMAPGIDVDGTAVSLLQHLGFGFMQVGPAGEAVQPRRYDADPLRIRERGAVAWSPHAAGPSAAVLAARIKTAPDLAIPVGMALRGPNLDAAIRSAEDGVAFFTLPSAVARSKEALAALRNVTRRPLVLRIDPTWDEDSLGVTLDDAADAGWDGCVAPGGVDCPILPGGILDGPFVQQHALRVIAQVSRRYGDRLPIIGAGGMARPEEALAQLDAGATLLQLYAGLVYAGPGLPARIDECLARRAFAAVPAGAREDAEPAGVAPAASLEAAGAVVAPRARWAWAVVTLTGIAASLGGVAGIIGTATRRLVLYALPALVVATEASGEHLDALLRAQLVLGGALLGWGVLTAWIAASRLSRREPWAFWSLLSSGLVGASGLVGYQNLGHARSWQAWTALGLAALLAAGLARSYVEIKPLRGPASSLHTGGGAWIWSPAGLGRIYVSFVALAVSAGGLAMMWGGRSALGGVLSAAGLAALLALRRGARPAERGLWVALLLWGISVLATLLFAAVADPGVTIATALLFVVGMTNLHGPLCRADAPADAFPET